MNYWLEELALVESAALRIQAIEEVAEERFDQALAAAERQGGPGERAIPSGELSAWLSARHDTNAAWGRWAEVMKARPRL
ncbi:MAG: hypothetical protein NVS2B4_02070 [Ramlibacter sp.]